MHVHTHACVSGCVHVPGQEAWIDLIGGCGSPCPPLSPADTNGLHRRVHVPRADILIHSGNFARTASGVPLPPLGALHRWPSVSAARLRLGAAVVSMDGRHAVILAHTAQHVLREMASLGSVSFLLLLEVESVILLWLTIHPA